MNRNDSVHDRNEITLDTEMFLYRGESIGWQTVEKFKEATQ